MRLSRLYALYFLILFSLLSPAVYGQLTDRQFILSKNVQLSHSEIDNGYTRFTPTVRECLQADSLSQLYIKKCKNKYPWTDEIVNYPTYYKQYVGYYNLNKQKTLFINVFCKPAPEWKKSLVQVHGGGSCYFNLKVDLPSQKAFNLNVNAP